jgi:hypothetical protein
MPNGRSTGTSNAPPRLRQRVGGTQCYGTLKQQLPLALLSMTITLSAWAQTG